MPYPGRRTRLGLRISKAILLSLLGLLSFTVGIPIHPGMASTSAGSNSANPPTDQLGSKNFQGIGSDPVPQLNMPRTVVSSVDSLIGAGGVVQSSPDNLTIYNQAVAMRLRGGLFPHDELLSPTWTVLSSWSFWGVQMQQAGAWIPLLPRSSNFTILGTNATGTFVVRTMQVGQAAFTGTLGIIYEATSAGPLKWDLWFVPSSTGQYRLVYAWNNITNNYNADLANKQFRAAYALSNYTLSWNDVPSSFNTSITISPGVLALTVGLGSVAAGSRTVVDPSVIGKRVPPDATAYTFQRKVFYEPIGGRYWAFYASCDVCALQYASSADGSIWSSPTSLPANNPYVVDSRQDVNLVSIYNIGRSVVVAQGQSVSGGSNANLAARLYYWIGTISGTAISWSVQNVATFENATCPNPYTYCSLGIRYVSVTLTTAADGTEYLSFSYNRFFYESYTFMPQCGLYVESYLQVIPQFNLLLGTGTTFSVEHSAFTISGQSNLTCLYPDPETSVVLQADNQGRIFVVYQFGIYSTDSSGNEIALDHIELHAAKIGLSSDGSGQVGAPETIDGKVSSNPEFSAVVDSNYVPHVVYVSGTDGSVSYAYRPAAGPPWIRNANILSTLYGSTFPARYPTITIDQYTGALYVMAVQGSSIVMRSRPPLQSWYDQSNLFPVIGRVNPSNLTSNYASNSATNSSKILLLWTEGGTGTTNTYNATFASIPISTTWSPYGSKDPWDGNGLAPYGQYFSNLGEYVSPSTGMLTIRQTDLTVPGRGFDLEITRVYTEPYSFLGGTPYSFEKYPWAALGNGWHLNFPWMNTIKYPSYIHLWDGEGYAIPRAFWNGTSSFYEVHQGENFRVVRNSTGIFLYNKAGVAYLFDPTNSNRLTKIIDTVGNNITFTYNGAQISSLADTVGRMFLFCYNGNNQLSTIEQASGQCGGEVGLIRKLSYGYSGADLTSFTDPAGRHTTYQYNGVADPNIGPWILSRIIYPTTWYSTYTYSQALLGTQANSYRVSRQMVNASSTPTSVRSFQYNYTQGPGDQVTHSFVLSYNGTSRTPVSNTTYAFSFALSAWNVTDSSHRVLRGDIQYFGMHGEIPKETVIVSDGSSGLGSYTNYYRYDLWGNQIYSRRAITPSSSHESFNAYYNNGLPLGFNAFQETFSQGNYTSTDNPWNVYNGTWLVKNRAYNGTWNSGSDNNVFTWADLGKGDLSISAGVYITNNKTGNPSEFQRIGVFTHYPGSGNNKWGLVLHAWPGGSALELVNDPTTGASIFDPAYLGVSNSSARTGCSVITGVWYYFTLAVHGSQAIGTVTIPSLNMYCTVSGTFPSGPATSGTAFGLYSGGYSALFDNVTVATLAYGTSSASFTNSFLNQSPNPSIHGSLAGMAELQSASAIGIMSSVETYFSYFPWGGLSQSKHLYNVPAGFSRWLTVSRTYDSYGNLAKLTDPKGNQTLYGYSLKYHSAYLTSQNQTLVPGGTLISRLYSYNLTMGTLLSSVDPNGYNTTYGYDILNRPTRVTYPNGNFVAYTYNDSANYVNTTNENGWLTQQKYDGLGRLSTVYRFLSGKPYSNETQTYDWQNRIVTTKDPLGNTYTSQYDALGRLAKMIKPDGNTTSTTYNDVALYTITYDENSVSKEYFYDRLGRLITVGEHSQTLSAYTMIYYSYDEVGNLLQTQTSPVSNIFYNYDNLNRVYMTVYPSNVESYSYDNNGNLVKKVDRNNNQTSYGYDSLNRITKVTYYGSTSTTRDNYTYDKNNNLLQLQSRNATISYTYDLRNRVVCEVYFVNGATTAGGPCGNGGGGGSVAAGTLISLADRTQVPVQNLRAGMSLLSYNVRTGQYAVSTITSLVTVETTNMLVIRTQDPLPLMVDNATAQKLWVKQADGTVGWLSVTQLRAGDFLFNALDQQWTQVTGIEKAPSGLHRMFDIYTTAPFDYIANGYLDPPKSPSGPSGGTFQSGYSVSHYYSGEVQTGLTYNDFMVESFTYDGLGRIASYNISQPTGVISYALFSYYRNDELMGIKYGNNLVENFTYDTLSRVKTITVSSSLLSLNYRYNSTGTILSVTGSSTNTNSHPTPIPISETYHYDPLQRLTNSTVTSGSTTTTLGYVYDSAGNRVRQNVNSAVTSYSYNNANNQLLSSSGGTNVAYSYYPDGSLRTQNNTSTGTNWTYTWDVQGHLLKAATQAGAQGYYAYDGLGRRVESLEGSSALYYAYAGTETLLEHPTTGDTDYVFADGMRLAKITGYGGSSPAASYYITDALGSTRLVTDSSARVVFYDNYQPYGQDNAASGGETYKFTGKPVSATTGLYYYYHRWYDSSIGRFISPDPRQGNLENPQTLDPYVYVADSPLNNNDPSGEFINIIIGAVAGGLIGWAACGLTTGAWFSPGCGEAALVGAGTGALAGATLGLSLGVMGVAEAGTATLGQALVAGAISGTVSGIANFDLNSLFGLERPTWDNFIKDTTIGAVSGFLGGALGDALGGIKGESLDPRNLAQELQQSGEAFMSSVSRDAQTLAGFLGDAAAQPIRISSPLAKAVIGGGVELGKALLTGVIDPGLKSLVQFFSTPGTQSPGPVVWHDIGDHRG